jgi:hypothetical protein
MMPKALVCGIWLCAMAACGGATIAGREAETDSSVPLPDAAVALPPVADAGSYGSADVGPAESDAGVAPAADGGSHDAGVMAMAPDAAPGPVQEPEPEPPPALPAPLTVSFTPAGGGFASPFALQLSAAEPGDEVHYTLDGSLPSVSSPLASGTLPIASSTLVRAMVVRAGRTGPITNQAYFRLDADAAAFRSDLPVIVIDMQNAQPPEPYTFEHVDALIGVFEPGEDGATQLERAASVTSRIGIKVRGRSTRYQPKPSYTLELRGVADEDAPAALLGMPAEADWVLYAPYDIDRSLMHNTFGYELSRRIGRYAPRTRYCEVFLVSNTTGVSQASYAGIYVLTERITRGKSRVAVQKLNAEDITMPALTGGYIFQANEPDPGDQVFTAAGKQFLYVHPKQEVVAPVQTQYITGYLDSVMRASSAADGVDPTTGQHYSTLIDVPAFIDHHILNVLLKNPDAFALSSYFHKDRNGPLAAGPLWDLDLAMRADDPWGQRSIDPTGWNPSTDSIFARSFWGPLFKHQEFEAAYWERWQELLAGPLAAEQLISLVDKLEQQLLQAAPRNLARWPASASSEPTFADEIQTLREWLRARVAWITANAGTLPNR